MDWYSNVKTKDLELDEREKWGILFNFFLGNLAKGCHLHKKTICHGLFSMIQYYFSVSIETTFSYVLLMFAKRNITYIRTLQ